MKDTVDSKKVVGKFVGKYIAFAIIIGGISFVLENVVPQFVDWDFTSTLIIYQSVLFVISTILTITLAVSQSIKNVKISSEDEAKKIAKPIKTILIIVALILMIVNLVYCYGIEQSGYKDVEKKYPIVEGTENEHDELCRSYEKEKVHLVSNIYMATKEISTVLTYGYAVIYVEKMLEASVEKKETKKSNKKEEK